MKALKWGLLIAVLGTLIWYFFLKEYDYQISFEAKTTVGTVNQSIKSWNSSLENPQPIQQISENELLQTILRKDTAYHFLWKIESEDSLVKVTSFVKSTSQGLKNRLLIPFTETTFERNSTQTVKTFLSNLTAHLQEINITIEGEDSSPETYAACVYLKTLQIRKAKGMMENFSLLSGYIADNQLQPNGKPFIEVTSWDRTNDSLAYRFCFPFTMKDSLPVHPLISIEKFTSKKSVKAVYNGNYITSDRAWYVLEDYAKKKNIPLDMYPVEVFYNNPNMGGDERKWVTEIYIPIKED
ncbi:MAG: GyrI-like domain-containing protein [Flavobacteriaceae bacterium]|nr:AraC family transcriptional regulator [Flavobacteriaceae bacterium]